LAKVKCVSNLVKAFSLLPVEQQSRSRLDIFGDGPERPRLEREVAQLALGAKVTFHGAIASDRAVLAFRRANALVLPSTTEPWGIVVNEAMASGVPVIAPYWIGAIADLVREGETGLIAANNSPEALASAMTWAVLNRGAMHKMGQTARDLIVREGWSLDGAIAALSTLLSAALLSKDQRLEP
jgi:glycosyltransferase involved in cell wall biosynthesis